MRFTNKVSLLAMILILFCFVVILSSCHDAETTVPDTTTVPVTTTAPDSTTAPDTTTVPDTTEDETARLESVGLDGDLRHYFSDEFKERVSLDEDGALQVHLYLQEEYKTKEDYEAFADKYGINGWISTLWMGDYYKAYYIQVSADNMVELKAYALLPEVRTVDFNRKAIPAG